MAKQLKSKAQRGLVTFRIIYANRRHPHARNQELKVDLRRGTVLDTDYAVGLVALRTPLALEDIRIVRTALC